MLLILVIAVCLEAVACLDTIVYILSVSFSVYTSPYDNGKQVHSVYNRKDLVSRLVLHSISVIGEI